MIIKLLQLNIEKGKRLGEIATYIKRGNFDIVCLQEVTSGKFSATGINTFETLKKETGLDGFLAPYLGFAGDASSCFANATLFGARASLVVNHTIWLKRYEEVSSLKLKYEKMPRAALAVLLNIHGKKLMVINTHLAWGPTPQERVYQTNQASKLYEWIRNHREDPFVLTGDFNLNPHTFTVARLGSLGTNLITKYKITNTLNPMTHRVPALFPSGIACDYIITDRRLAITNFFVEEQADLSDHFGLVVTFSL